MNIIAWNAMIGVGSRNEVPNTLKARSWGRAWVIVDPGVVDQAIVQEMLAGWSSAGIDAHVTVGPSSEPTYAHLEERRGEVPSSGADVVIGVGGGTTLDLAKGLAVLATNAGPALEYRGFNKFQQPPLPVVAIPTIAGSGADVTPNASFVDGSTKKKLGINGEAIRPALGVLDAQLAAGAPLPLVFASGFDALVHAVEAYNSRRATGVARHLAFQGVRAVSRSLLEIRENGPGLSALEDLLFGASLSAMAMANGGTGAAAALSYPVGVHLGVPHGLAGALFLPEVVRLNISRGATSYEGLLEALPGRYREGLGRESSVEARVHAFAEGLSALRDALDLRCPEGVTPDEGLLSIMCEDLKGLQGALDTNAAPFGIDDGHALFQQVLSSV